MIETIQVLTAHGSEGPKGIDLLMPHLSEVFWSLLAVLIVAIMMVKFALPKFNALLDERSSRIEHGLALAKKAETDAKNADAEAKRIIAEARQVAAEIREAADQEAKKTIADAVEEAHQTATRIMDAAERHIAAERQVAQITLRTEVGMLAVELAEKIIGEQLEDRELSARVVDRFLDDLEASSVQLSTKEA